MDTRKLDDIAATYKIMWTGPQYRHCSPALRHVAEFMHYAARSPGDTLIDLGCGMGYAGKFFYDRCRPRTDKPGCPLNVFLFDLIPEAVEVEGLPFIQGNIWDLSALPIFDWIFCSDVLEHIPPEQVDATLKGMARITRKGGLLGVCHLESDATDFGLDADKLHLSVHPREWWQERIEEYWTIKSYQSDWKETSFFVEAA